MSFTVTGVDGFLLVLAALCFLAAAVLAFMARFGPGHRAVIVLISAGLFCWVLASLVH